MIKKILLIEPPVTRPSDFSSKKVRLGIVPPIGLAYIAAVLLKNGFEVEILDCIIDKSLKGQKYCDDMIRYGLSDEEIKQKIISYDPDVVGISCLFSAKAFDMFNMARIVKEVNPKIITLSGGAHPTNDYKLALQDNNLDFVVLGEGEYSTLNLIRTINANLDLSKVDGIAYKRDNKVILNPKTQYIENLDELPLPARHLLKMDNYILSSSPHSGVRIFPFTSMITSRGCPAKCTFCVIRDLWGSKARFRSAENVLKEIEFLVNVYGIREIHFEDDNITAIKSRAMAIFQGIIDKGWNLSLSSPSGLSVYSLDEELLRIMKKAGYYSISLAVESGDKEVLKMMRKPVNLEKVKGLFDIARKIGLKTKGFFILGYPGETKEQMKKTVDFAANLNIDWALFFIATAIPGSDLDKICREKGYLINENLGYFKQFYVSNIRTEEFDPEFVENIRERANLEINFKNNTNLRLGNYDRAIEDIGDVARLYPHLDFAHYYLGIAYEKNGQRDKAIAEFEKTLELNPQYMEADNKLKKLKNV